MKTSLLCLCLSLLAACTSLKEGTVARASRATIDRSLFQLTAIEKERAAEIANKALSDQNLRGAGRIYQVAVDLADEKTDSGEPAKERLALVTYYRYDDDTAIQTLVELSSGRIIRTTALPHVPVQLAKQEVEEAKKLALENAQVRQALSTDPSHLEIEALLSRAASREDALWGHRVVHLLFRVGRGYLTTPIVVVDLTDRRVIIEQSPPRVP